MAAGIEIYNYVTNQKGSPALYSDVLANRPAAGFIGRLFISTDTFEIYRDNGTTWDLISGGGGGVNIYNSNGSLTAARTMTMAGHNLTFEGNASPTRLIMSADNNVARVFSFRTANVARWDFTVDDNETGSNTGANWHLRAHNDAGAVTFNPISVTRANGEKSFYAQASLTAGSQALAGVFNISAGTYGAGLTFIGGNAHAAQFNNFTLANGGSFTFASSSFVGASGNVLRVQANASGTVTMAPSTPGIRTAAVSLNQIQYNTSGSAALTYTHAANIQTLGILQLVASGSLTVTNAYGLIINDLNEYGNPSSGAGALILTNRWGIYQDSTTDVNYLGGTTLIGTTTNAGYKLDVAGTLRNTLGANFAATSGNVGIGTASPAVKLDVTASGGDIAAFRRTDAGNALVQYTNANTTDDIILRFRLNAGAGNFYDMRYYGTGGYFGLQYNGNNGLHLTTSSKVLINTTSDAGDYKLQVSGNIYNTGSAVLAATGGNVGIGTVSPADRITVQSTVGDACAMTFRANGVTSTSELFVGQSIGNDAFFYNRANAIISFGTANIERARFTNSGNLLINTTTDSGQKVQINSSLRLIPTSTVPTASAGTLYYDTATNKLKLYDGTSWVDLN
jgi:hypothetical protein